ncbi:MAG: FliG C-terminal domain-containing protein, partial [Elusimicrobiota bacterium]
NPIMELFKNSEFLSVVLKWATIAILILIGLMLATLFILLALRSFFGVLENWVTAFATLRNRRNEVKIDLPEWLKDMIPILARAWPDLPPPVITEEEKKKKELLPDIEAIVIPVSKAADLFYLIGKEDPAHIALVVAKLPEDTKSAFLSRLPLDRMGQVLASLSNPQYVEPEVMQRLKDELEKRILGVVGGEEETVRVLDATSLSIRLKMLKTLERQNAELYRNIRKRVLVFEDLLYYTEQELNVLLSKIPIQDLTIAIADTLTPLNLKEKIMRSLPKRTAQTLNELLSMTGKPPEDKVLSAQDKILKAAQKLIAESGLRHPLSEMSLPK